MNRDKDSIMNRRAFIKEYFGMRKKQNPKITLKEISIELSDWYLFMSPKYIRNEYRKE
jgi:hypothetical protein